MELLKIREINPRSRELFDRGIKAAERDNYAYAIDMFRTLLRKEPGLMEARQRLRAVELKKIGNKANLMRQMLANILGGWFYCKGAYLSARGKHVEALDNGEAAMKLDPTSSVCCAVLARAAEEADIREVSREVLELACKYHPKNQLLLDWLARTYLALEEGGKAKDIYQKLWELAPTNRTWERKLRQAMAAAELDKGWEDAARGDKDYRDLIKDKGEAVRLEQQDRAGRDKGVASDMIADLERILLENESVADRKKLARLYTQEKNYDKALENYNRVIELQDTPDVAVESAIVEVIERQYDAAIRRWQEFIDDEETLQVERQDARNQVAAIEHQKRQAMIARLAELVAHAPGADPERLKLATQYYNEGMIEDAMNHFQLLQKRPRFIRGATMYMGRCFMAKGLHDMAVTSFQEIIDSASHMDSTKKEALYEMGKAFEGMENVEQAAECFKQIYQVDLNFRDVAEIMSRLYNTGG